MSVQTGTPPPPPRYPLPPLYPYPLPGWVVIEEENKRLKQRNENKYL